MSSLAQTDIYIRDLIIVADTHVTELTHEPDITLM